MAHGPRNKRLDFGGNPDHVTLGLGWGRVRVRWVSQRHQYRTVRFTRRLFNNKKFAVSAEVCALLSAVLVTLHAS